MKSLLNAFFTLLESIVIFHQLHKQTHSFSLTLIPILTHGIEAKHTLRVASKLAAARSFFKALSPQPTPLTLTL